MTPAASEAEKSMDEPHLTFKAPWRIYANLYCLWLGLSLISFNQMSIIAETYPKTGSHYWAGMDLTNLK